MRNYSEPIFIIISALLLLILCACQSMTPVIVENISTATILASVTTEIATPIVPSQSTPQTKEEQIAQEIAQSGGQFTSSADECSKILETEPWCGIIGSAVHITRPEWKTLFPKTEFFIVKRILYGGEFPQQRNLLIVEQDNERYVATAETFTNLLNANNITITDENRELVAKALVLMLLPDYLEGEITFSNWKEGSWPAPIRLDYNYSFIVWTKLQGLEIQFYFLFYEGQLIGAEGVVVGYNVGEYLNVPLPSQESLTYWKKR